MDRKARQDMESTLTPLLIGIVTAAFFVGALLV